MHDVFILQNPGSLYMYILIKLVRLLYSIRIHVVIHGFNLIKLVSTMFSKCCHNLGHSSCYQETVANSTVGRQLVANYLFMNVVQASYLHTKTHGVLRSYVATVHTHMHILTL